MTETFQTTKESQVLEKLPGNFLPEAKSADPKSAPEELQDASARVEVGQLTKYTENTSQFAKYVHAYTTELIKLADQKAIFIFAFASAVIVYLHSKNVHKLWFTDLKNWHLQEVFAFLSMTILGIGLVAACWVIRPRLKSTQKCYVFFNSIVNFKSADQYILEIFASSDNNLNKYLLYHTYNISKVCSAKYTALNIAIWATLTGTLTTVILILNYL